MINTPSHLSSDEATENEWIKVTQGIHAFINAHLDHCNKLYLEMPFKIPLRNCNCFRIWQLYRFQSAIQSTGVNHSLASSVPTSPRVHLSEMLTRK